MKSILLSLVFLSSLFLFFACGSNSDEPEAPVTSEEVPSYEVKGRFLSADTEVSSISVVHEEIPGVMNAMRMQILVRDFSVTEELNRGDIISFTLTRDGMSWFARDIEVLPPDTELDLPENLQRMGLD